MSDLRDRISQLSPEKRALLERRLGESAGTGPRVAEPIAVVGLGCRFPGADGPEAFWDLLASGADVISGVPAERWDAAAMYDADPAAAGKVATRWGGFLEGIDRFDPYFFGISPREAARMDPQQRLWLEVAWESLEDAGFTMDALAGSATGVFLGLHSHSSDYFWMQLGDPAQMDAFTGPGNAHNIAAGRLAYVLDLRGPAVTIDTACSSSLVAIHMACQSLRAGDCRTAVAGGVNAMLSPIWSIPLSRMQMLSPTGRCRAFDAAADGFVRGEGAGAVVLKRLPDAMADGDRVLAVIRGSALNQDGRTNGITAPNGLSQRALLRDALRNSGVRAAEVSHVEAHGTGTAVGDPIELEAIAEVLSDGRGAADPCWLGAAKSNFGHLEGAAGVAGLIKVVLSLQRRAIPPVAHFTSLNPAISVDVRQFPVPTRVEPWTTPRRIAGVSSFGWSGTNAHIVLEEAPEITSQEEPKAPSSHLLPISARSGEALRAVAGRYRELLAAGRAEVAAVCRTAALRRTHFEHRLTVAGESATDIVEALDGYLGGSRPWAVAEAKARTGRPPSPVFVFSGQGPQWAGMGRDLLDREPVFRAAMERCDALMAPLAGWSVIAELSAPPEASRLDRTAVAQPVIFALQVALTELWRSWGVRPAAAAGHSVGEIAAAWCAGALSLEDAARIAVQRGSLMDRATGQGRMLSVESPVAGIRAVVTDWNGLDVAAINAPRSVVLSGDTDAVERAAALLSAQEIATRYLPVQYAFHSHQMDAVVPELVTALGEVPARDGQIPFVSTVTGGVCPGRELTAAYWGRNVRGTVRFADAIAALAASNHAVYLEIGPHPVLRHSIAQSAGVEPHVAHSLHRGRDGARSLLANLGGLHAAGCAVAWSVLYPGRGPIAALPSYPWQRERYWLDHVVPYTGRSAGAQASGDDRTAQADALLYAPEWIEDKDAAGAAAAAPGRWLILSDRGGVGSRIAAELERRGHTCAIEPAPDANAADAGASNGEVAAAACRRLLEAGAGPWRGIVHLWSLDATGGPVPTADSLEAAQIESCAAVLALARGMSSLGDEAPPLWIATRNAQAVRPGDRPSPVQAPVWGLARTLGIEHPNLKCVRIDLPAEPDAAVTALVEELGRPPLEPEVAARSGQRFVPRLRRLPRGAASAPAVISDATYLVTGGLGALGLETAAWLVSKGARHVVLTGRSGAGAAAQPIVDRLRSQGASIDVVRADVSRREDVDRVLARIAATPFPLKGIVHAAGVLDDGVALQQDWGRLRKVFAPKIRGAWNLHAASAGLSLDFFVLYSSLASLLGSAGQANYAAGNAFLDALAHLRRAEGLPALSVNWGAWSGTGMAASLDEASRRRLSEAGIDTMDAPLALAGLERAMAGAAPQAGVLAIDWDRYLRYRGGSLPFVSQLKAATTAVAAAETAGPTLIDALAEAPEERRRAVVLQHVRREALAVLGVPPGHALDDAQGLRDAGLDSLMALELKNRLQTTTGKTLPSTLAFDYPTTAALADYLAGLLGLGTAEGAAPAAQAPAASAPADLDAMSDDEAAALLAEELAALQRGRAGASGYRRG